MILAIAVLLPRLVAGTVCLADDANMRLLSGATAATATMPVDLRAQGPRKPMLLTACWAKRVAATAAARTICLFRSRHQCSGSELTPSFSRRSSRPRAHPLANVPFATIGGIVGLAITGQYLSVPSAIGFIAVFSVAMLNGIVLVSFLNEHREKGLTVRDAVITGTALRMRPVLITASVAILGLVPMLLSSGVGAETQRPLATVVVGGLITSTLLTLILLLVLYDWMEERAAGALEQK